MQVEVDFILKAIGMILIGALIGAVTNHLAIRMLFRPLEAKYIGKYRIPFTPGLIPKRRDELAANLGRTVVKHLLTPEGISKRLQQPVVYEAITRMIQQELQKWTRSTITIREIAERFVTNPEERLHHQMEQRIDQELATMIDAIKTARLSEVIGDGGTTKIKAAIPGIVEALLHQTEQYFESPAGKMKLEETVAQFIQSKLGGGMFGMLLANVNIVEMIQPELKRVIQGKSTHQFISEMVEQEVGTLLEQPVESLLEVETERQITERMKSEILTRIPLTKLWDTQLHELLEPFEARISQEMVPVLSKQVVVRLVEQVERILATLDLETIVREEVDLLDTAYLEEIVLSISRREFRAITWLGGLLGGLIGVIQAILLIV
ncbi:DUF445 domain-containing protein [Exiguobacterium antarcticum]|uniref:DUF445 domain-containing protein n=1 Tax=Exiguobacterium antarcticum TaxID=132920 RepID=UPI000285ED13|nr:DUF445 family protein [Exiguobacterium antarcticum]AFS69803.1 Hypothetical protein Eab7_0654 [Exiguobacterium antarcticum B7]